MKPELTRHPWLEERTVDYWELFWDTGAPEAYLLWRGQQEAVCKTEKQ